VATLSNIGVGPHFGSGVTIDAAAEKCQQKA
jgi:hypothetical protein